jgi:beta-glucanase (GH16 family)
MKTPMIKELVALIILIIQQFTVDGQSPPIYDKNWVLNPGLSDEFNGTQIDPTKWSISNNVRGWSYCTFISSFASVNNGYLNLKADYIGSTLYTSGIYTTNYNYLYGYYEMNAKLPGYFNPITQQYCNKGFWTAFWNYYDVRTDSNCILQHDEIDIIELDGCCNQVDGCSIGGGGCIQDGHCGHTNVIFPGGYVVHNLPPLSQAYHKYACEWYPNRVIYYFDDVPVASSFNNPNIPSDGNNTRVVIDNQLLHQSDFNSNTPWPQIYSIDYFHYYQLNMSYCGTDATINSNSDLANFQYGVRRNITIGNGSSSISLNVGDNITLRTSNTLTINGNFTVPLGSVLNIIPTPCQ